ncbi:MAG: phosphatidylglycerophosphatase A [Acidimicrobiia bacterium]|nr:phosphatidylglycerophosphatase A [Acidimicrobiia bacterium]MBT8246286.1 phosphatidylglycerophosphatase A [Acidimicrobiia bacterium]NNL13943.1 phosphatidylglycerophosphatase A [Acidimicrobiia bacterium]
MRRLLASSFGLGLIPRRIRGSDAGAGTFGAALAIPLALAVDSAWLEISLVAVVAVAGIWAARPFASGDPGWIVIDETAGAWLGVIGLGGWPFVIGWLVARVADITKWPPGVGAAERLPGAWGVMADDLVAGLYGLAAGWAITAL